MREKLWLTRRKSSVHRCLYRLPVLSSSLRILGFSFVPSARRVKMPAAFSHQ